MSLHTMDTSPLSTPGTPRTCSPSPFDDDPNSPPSPSQGDARTILTQSEADGDWDSATEATPEPIPCPTREPATKPVKGKEKARKGPLRLLDLPVDILKEIIHQVGI